MSHLPRVTFLGLATVAALSSSVWAAARPAPGPDRQAALGAYGRLPLVFEANQGQVDREVSYLSRGDGYDLFLTPSEAVMTLRRTASAGPPRRAALRMRLLGADPAPVLEAEDPQPGSISYFVGNDPHRWRTHVPVYGRVAYRSVYPGVDLLFYGNQRQLEYDFVVRPGADPGRIRLAFAGAEEMTLTDGELRLATPCGEVRWQRPIVYQVVAGERRPVAARYLRRGARQVGFALGAYDRRRPLIIDPVAYSTYLGGSGYDAAFGIAVDSSGHAYVTGTTSSLDFPRTAGALQPAYPGLHGNSSVAFVTKLNPGGTAMVYSTYLGGDGFHNDIPGDRGVGIAVDAAGSAYVTGITTSSNFPVTPGAMITRFGGFEADAFVTKLSPDGAGLAYSTYLNGSVLPGHNPIGDERGSAIAVTAAGVAYVTGSFEQGAYGDDFFVARLNGSGSALDTYFAWVTPAHEWGAGLALDEGGHVYVTGAAGGPGFFTTSGAAQGGSGGGTDAFVAKLDAFLNPIYSTYLGGGGEDQGYGIAVDATGSAYVTGRTESANFPHTRGAYRGSYGGGGDAFVTKLSPSGGALSYSTYFTLGSNPGGFEAGYGITVDGAGNAAFTGTYYAGGYGEDLYVAFLNSTGSALLGYYNWVVPGDDRGLALARDHLGGVYVAGSTSATNFLITPGALQRSPGGGGDAFVMKIAP